ncbi:hypothetical protein B0H16DRAFT_1831857 [Mycena metata]|uniref:Uncharacterized protein n=1 Tax=Mycena metata TaxID=1033252 RepID=A0AAD7GMZ3_9AGAR|nr:hypothetical protein B0H16DRAFT_1831857 [Mycena metata]
MTATHPLLARYVPLGDLLLALTLACIGAYVRSRVPIPWLSSNAQQSLRAIAAAPNALRAPRASLSRRTAVCSAVSGLKNAVILDALVAGARSGGGVGAGAAEADILISVMCEECSTARAYISDGTASKPGEDAIQIRDFRQLDLFHWIEFGNMMYDLAPKFPSTFTLLDVLHAGDHCSSRVQLLLSTGLSEILLVEEQQLSLRMSISKALQQIRRMSTLLPDTLESEVFKDTLARLENQRIWLNNSRSLRQCISSFRKIVPLLSRGLQLLQQDYARYPPPVEFDRSIPSSQTGSSTTTGVEPVEPPQFLNAKSKSKPAAGASKKRKRKSGQSDDDASEFIPVISQRRVNSQRKVRNDWKIFCRHPRKPPENPPTTSQQQQLTNFAFTSTKPAPPTGVSSRLTTFGVPEKKLNEPTVDNSRYLWPSHIFPVLNDPMVQPEDAIEQTAMELTDVDFDPRDIVLNFGSCYLEILTIEDWIGVSRTPAKVKSIETSQLSTLSSAAKARMFRVVIAIEMGSHVLAWLSNDGNVRTYWLSLEDINIVKPFRVPGKQQLFYCENGGSLRRIGFKQQDRHLTTTPCQVF